MMKTTKGSLAIAALLALSACGIFKGGGKKTPVLGDRVPILLSESAVETDKTIAAVQVLLPAPEVNTEWTQPGGNAAKSMGHVALGQTLARAWSVGVDGGSNRQRLAAPPVIGDGKMFVMDVDATVHAFAADTGAVLWTASIVKDKENQGARFGGGVSYEDGKVYASDGLGDLVSLNAADGKEVWRSKPGGPLRGSPTVAYGNVYVLTQDNQLFAVSTEDGKVGWNQSGSLESQGVFGVAAPSASAGTIVAGFSSGELNAYRYENGRGLWQDALSRSAISTSVFLVLDDARRPQHRAGDRPGPRICRRAGRAHGGDRHRHWAAHLVAELCGHFHAVDRGRMAVPGDRRRQARLPQPQQWRSALDQPAEGFQEREEALGADHLVRPGAGRQPAGADQFRRRDRLRRQRWRRDGGDDQVGRADQPAADRGQQHAVRAGHEGAGFGVSVRACCACCCSPAEAGVQSRRCYPARHSPMRVPLLGPGLRRGTVEAG
jgi:hypothetical protein